MKSIQEIRESRQQVDEILGIKTATSAVKGAYKGAKAIAKTGYKVGKFVAKDKEGNWRGSIANKRYKSQKATDKLQKKKDDLEYIKKTGPEKQTSLKKDIANLKKGNTDSSSSKSKTSSSSGSSKTKKNKMTTGTTTSNAVSGTTTTPTGNQKNISNRDMKKNKYSSSGTPTNTSRSSGLSAVDKYALRKKEKGLI